MKRAERLAAHYIRANDLRAVYLATVGGLVRLAITREPATQARALKRKRHKLHCVYWLSSSVAAATLIRAACDTFPGIDCGANVRPSAVEAALPQLAHGNGLALTTDFEVQKRAATVAVDIEARVKGMQSSGHLRGLNGAYRDQRADAARRGVPFMSYGDYLERYKIRMLYDIAAALRGQNGP